MDQLSVKGVKVSEDEEREVLESKFEEKHAEKDNLLIHNTQVVVTFADIGQR